MGVEVRYLAYPRAGINSESYRKIATAWCAVDPQDAITRIKNGENLADNVCTPNPVADQFLLGQQVGVRGTPAMILESGEMLPGYMPALELGRKLGIN
jgi:thiol:disulfide interchange protein DsbC